MIERTEFGRMEVNGVLFTADLIILPQRILAPWRRQEGHRLFLADFGTIFEEDLQAVVVGTGFFGRMRVSEEIRRAAREKGLELHIGKTRQAAALFNTFSGQKRTAGAFHLTC
jgi:hypothetical protein